MAQLLESRHPSSDTHHAKREYADEPEQDSPLYATDNFRIYCFKVLPCSKRYCHDWTVCPFAHPGEKAKRRDVRIHNYTGQACPDMKKTGQCARGDTCAYSHNVFEYWLHPSRYRTQLCNDGTSCKRRVCFFAHTMEELRVSPERRASAASGAGSGLGTPAGPGMPLAPLPAFGLRSPLGSGNFSARLADEQLNIASLVQQQQQQAAAAAAAASGGMAGLGTSQDASDGSGSLSASPAGARGADRSPFTVAMNALMCGSPHVSTPPAAGGGRHSAPAPSSPLPRMAGCVAGDASDAVASASLAASTAARMEEIGDKLASLSLSAANGNDPTVAALLAMLLAEVRSTGAQQQVVAQHAFATAAVAVQQQHQQHQQASAAMSGQATSSGALTPCSPLPSSPRGSGGAGLLPAQAQPALSAPLPRLPSGSMLPPAPLPGLSVPRRCLSIDVGAALGQHGVAPSPAMLCSAPLTPMGGAMPLASPVLSLRHAEVQAQAMPGSATASPLGSLQAYASAGGASPCAPAFSLSQRLLDGGSTASPGCLSAGPSMLLPTASGAALGLHISERQGQELDLFSASISERQGQDLDLFSASILDSSCTAAWCSSGAALDLASAAGTHNGSALAYGGFLA